MPGRWHTVVRHVIACSWWKRATSRVTAAGWHGKLFVVQLHLQECHANLAAWLGMRHLQHQLLPQLAGYHHGLAAVQHPASRCSPHLLNSCLVTNALRLFSSVLEGRLRHSTSARRTLRFR